MYRGAAYDSAVINIVPVSLPFGFCKQNDDRKTRQTAKIAHNHWIQLPIARAGYVKIEPEQTAICAA